MQYNRNNSDNRNNRNNSNNSNGGNGSDDVDYIVEYESAGLVRRQEMERQAERRLQECLKMRMLGQELPAEILDPVLVTPYKNHPLVKILQSVDSADLLDWAVNKKAWDGVIFLIKAAADGALPTSSFLWNKVHDQIAAKQRNLPKRFMMELFQLQDDVLCDGGERLNVSLCNWLAGFDRVGQATSADCLRLMVDALQAKRAVLRQEMDDAKQEIQKIMAQLKKVEGRQSTAHLARLKKQYFAGLQTEQTAVDRYQRFCKMEVSYRRHFLDKLLSALSEQFCGRHYLSMSAPAREALQKTAVKLFDYVQAAESVSARRDLLARMAKTRKFIDCVMLVADSAEVTEGVIAAIGSVIGVSSGNQMSYDGLCKRLQAIDFYAWLTSALRYQRFDVFVQVWRMLKDGIQNSLQNSPQNSLLEQNLLTRNYHELKGIGAALSAAIVSGHAEAAQELMANVQSAFEHGCFCDSDGQPFVELEPLWAQAIDRRSSVAVLKELRRLIQLTLTKDHKLIKSVPAACTLKADEVKEFLTAKVAQVGVTRNDAVQHQNDAAQDCITHNHDQAERDDEEVGDYDTSYRAPL